MRRPVVLATVGTSLLRPNLAGLAGAVAAGGADLSPAARATAPALIAAHAARDWEAVAGALAAVPTDDRLGGAELNATDSLVREGVAAADARVVLFHSDTADGRAVGGVLAAVFRAHGHAGSEAVPVADLRDDDPERFRVRGLRQLARAMGATIRAAGPGACVVNATGGYKAQVAVAVLVGQAAGAPVYYRHERFPTVIAFPPLPLTFDPTVWRRHRDLFARLDTGPVPRGGGPELDDRLVGLVEPTVADGGEWLELTAAGQVYHDACRDG